MDMTMAAEAKKYAGVDKEDSPVDRLWREMGSEMDHLESLIDNLERRLQPILYNGPQEAGRTTMDDSMPATSPLGERIAAEINRVRYQRNRITSILERLDI